MGQSTDLVVPESDPLVWADDEGRPHELERLDFVAERALLVDSLRLAGRSVSVQFGTATTDTLRTAVTLGCRAVHFSGHGADGGILFEGQHGRAQRVDSRLLKQLVAAGGPSSVRLAVVSACNSRSAGEAFVKSGVPHVVAIRLGESVYDEAARVFARSFYVAALAGKSVEQSFRIGCAAVEADPSLVGAGEGRKFVLLPRNADHSEAVFGEILAGP